MSDTITLPKATGGTRAELARLAGGIISSDQFDDWLPDALYLEDRSGGAAAAELEAIWKSGTISSAGVVSIEVPRAGGPDLPALALPFELRACLHQAVARIAGQISGVRRDKVLGFDFLDAGDRAFSAPGDSLEAAWEQVLDVLLFEGGAGALYDVKQFNRSIDLARLRSRLEALGAASDLAEFVLGRVGVIGGGGFASVDDATAFVANLYLTGVDDALFEKQANFVRHRDEYFVFGGSTRTELEQALAGLGLEATRHDLPDLEEIKYELQERISYDEPEAEESRPTPHRRGAIDARYECSSWEDMELCSTDYFEARFRRFGGESLVRSQLKGAQIIDGVAFLPALRWMHERRAGAGMAGWYHGAPISTRAGEWRDLLADFRPGIVMALRTGVEAGSGWQISWAALLLGDLAPVSAEEDALLETAAKQDTLPDYARQCARLALARASAAPEAVVCWTGDEPLFSGVLLRYAVLTAHVLKQRGVTGPWADLSAVEAEKGLRSFLEGQTA